MKAISRAEEATGTSHRCPDAKLLVSREEAGQLLSQPTRFGLPDSQPATACHKHWWKVLIPMADLRKYARGDHPGRIVS